MPRMSRFIRVRCWPRCSAPPAGGVDAAMSSDHFSPWSERQGQSGCLVVAGCGAAGRHAAVRGRQRAGTALSPAIIARPSARRAALYSGRVWAALGTGEASNEHVAGTGWPRKEVRNERLRECVDIIRALLRGEEVTHDGLVPVDRARDSVGPPEPPPLVGAAVSVVTARWCADWADGLITVNADRERLRRRIDAYRTAGGRGRLHLQVHLSWAPDRRRPRRSPTSSGVATCPAADLLGPRQRRKRSMSSPRTSRRHGA